jgi:hypothetical protein
MLRRMLVLSRRLRGLFKKTKEGKKSSNLLKNGVDVLLCCHLAAA